MHIVSTIPFHAFIDISSDSRGGAGHIRQIRVDVAGDVSRDRESGCGNRQSGRKRSFNFVCSFVGSFVNRYIIQNIHHTCRYV